jgi:hypothetical protein
MHHPSMIALFLGLLASLRSAFRILPHAGSFLAQVLGFLRFVTAGRSRKGRSIDRTIARSPPAVVREPSHVRLKSHSKNEASGCTRHQSGELINMAWRHAEPKPDR